MLSIGLNSFFNLLSHCHKYQAFDIKKYFSTPMLISVRNIASLIHVQKFTTVEVKQEYYCLLASKSKIVKWML